MRKIMPIVLLSLVLLVSCISIVTVDGGVTPSYTDWSWLRSDSSTMYVSLEENSSTGYEWVVSVDGISIVLTDEEYVAPVYNGMVGVPGEWDASFEAVCDGISTITFTYVRPWDLSDVADERIVMVTVDGGVITSVIEL